ncbi:MAG: hypothetical protein ACFE8A_00260 [Candidatus Hodarchaeota archaeon]
MSINLENSNDSELAVEPPRSSAIYKVFWEKNGSAICNLYHTESHDPQVCSDGAGGAIIVWVDNRSGDTDLNIYAQRIDKNGIHKWGANGTIICNKEGSVYTPKICSDGNGGAIIAWLDYRTTCGDIYAQRIDKYGKTKWEANGTVIRNALNDAKDLNICEDGNYGAIIAWSDSRTLIWDIYAQKITYNGDKEWKDNGIVISNSTISKGYLEMKGDNQGNAYFCWQDNDDYDIYAHKIDSTGKTIWRNNGTVVCNHTNTQFNPHLCIDEDGGAIIIWEDWRNEYVSSCDIYAQRINSTGHRLWKEGTNDYNGTKICDNAKEDFSPHICSDRSGGAIIAWEFNSSISGELDIHVQKIDKNGIRKWGNQGITISNETSDQNYPLICSDGFGGAIIAWTNDNVDPLEYDIYAQHITAAKTQMWGANGTAVCNAIYDQGEELDVCSDGLGGALFTWGDYRVDDISHQDIYAQRIGYPTSITKYLPTADDDDDDDEEQAIPGINPITILIPICCGIGITYILIRKRLKT